MNDARSAPETRFGFIAVIFIAALICVAHPAISCCVIDDFAAVISCIAFVLLSPSGSCITAASALAMPSFVQVEDFDFAASAGEAARSAVAASKLITLPMRFLPLAGLPV